MSTLYFDVYMYSVKESLPVSGLYAAIYTVFPEADSPSIL